jgi:PAS domain S-box-containing protein
MRTSEQILAEIEATFGFCPPFFSPALETPEILENLWQQTLSAYVRNPLPDLFKEKLAAYLARFCAVPYCLICHSCTLRPLGMKAKEIFSFLEAPLPLESEIERDLEMLAQHTPMQASFPSPGSAIETSLLNCAISIALEQRQSPLCRQQLQRILGTVNYQHLLMLITYNKTCLMWMESHPETSYLADRRAQQHLDVLLTEEPGLAEFFINYHQRIQQEGQSHAQELRALAERRRVDRELQKSEQRLQLALKAAQMGVWEWNLQTGEEIWSPETEHLLGIEPNSFAGRYESFLAMVHPDDREQCAQIEQKMLQTGTYELEFRIVRASDQQIRWLSSKGQVFYDLDGTPTRVLGVTQDITDRKQAEDNLRFLQNMTQDIFESEDFYSALTVTIQRVCESTHWEFGEAWILNHNRSALVCCPAWYSKDPSLTEFRQQSEQFSFALGVGLPGRIWESGCPEWCQDVSLENTGRYLRSQLALASGLRAALGIPIIANGEVITVLVFYMYTAREEDQRLIDLISASTELGSFILRKQAEEQVRSSLREKEVLLKEIHHRVKNNLQMISSLLRLQANSIQDPHILAPFRESQSRVRAMALIHERLYQSNSLARIHFPEYVHKLATDLLHSYCETPSKFDLQVDVADVELDVDTIIPCGLIINELVSNSIKYAFQNSTDRKIGIYFASTGSNQYQLTVCDNGVGLPSNVDFRHTASLGLQLVCSLVQQLQGTITLDCSNGAVFTITFHGRRE